MTDPDHGLVVGSRLMVGRHGAVIRYIGPVDGQEGTWVGLEWDDPSRGKHDGTHAGRRYFSCVRHPSAGSLVRLPKLIATADAGCTLETAIQVRYKSGEGAAETNEDAYVSTASHRRVPIRLVGAAAAAAVACEDGALEAASFVEMRISSLEHTPTVISFLSRVVSLDLSNNLLASWPAVAAAAAALPSLRSLNLSGNLLELDNLESVRAAPKILGLQTLVLNNCGVGWAAAAAVATATPSLVELHLCDNGIEKLGSVDNDALSSLESLDLENNRLSDWTDVAAALVGLPRLCTLFLGCNQLSKVTYPGAGFEALQQLALGGNRIDSWAAVDQLDRFPALNDVRLSDNPLYDALKSYEDKERRENGGTEGQGAGRASDARYETVARISKLKILNGGEISAGERWDSELAYLRRITDEVAASGGGSGAGAAHPRFAALVEKYGELTASAPAAAAKGTTLASSMVELTLVGPGGKKVVKKRVPATLTVGKLKPVLERLLRLKLAHQTLMLVDPSGAVAEDITAQDGRELRLYGVADRWRVEVGERDAVSAAAAREAAAAEQERRMEEHERGLQRLRDEEERLMGAVKG